MRSMRWVFAIGVLAVASWLSARETVRTAATVAVIGEELLTEIKGDLHDQLLLDLGKKGVRNSVPGVVPEGWNCRGVGSSYECSGPAVRNSHFSFRPSGNYRFPNRVDVGVRYQGESLFQQRMNLERGRLPEIANSLEGVLGTPAQYSPGSYFMVQPLKDGYSSGTWRAHVDGDPLSAEGLAEYALSDGTSLSYKTGALAYSMPSGIGADAKISYTYDDPWGQRLVDAPATDYLIGDPLDDDCRLSISSCPSKAAVGGTLCVCGCFPQPTSGYSLLLDGKPAPVVGGSPWATTLSLADVQPGAHIVSWAGGSGGTGVVDFEAVAVGGQLAQGVIQKGGHTNMELWVDGTSDQVDMALTSPDTNITIQGGNTQVATTSGGADNDINRTVWGNQVGPFGVGFMIELPPCPCGFYESDPDDLMARHPMSLEGRGSLSFPDGGLTLPVDFASEDFFSLTPQPPITTDPFEIQLRQLGLNVNVGDFAPFAFEARSDVDSLGRFSNIQVDDQGHLRSADVDVDLYSQFSVDYSKSLPLQVGMRYEFGLDDWGFTGEAPDLGRVRFEQRPGSTSSIVLDEIGTNSAGTLLHGYSRISLLGRLTFDGRF